MPRYGKDNAFEKSGIIWWEPGEIRYRRDHVMFILEHLNTFMDGRYPPDPGQTGYSNAGWKSSINTKAPFITAAEIFAELDRRLLRCGLDWYLVHDHYERGLIVEDIATLHHMDYEDVWNRIQRAITYVSSGPVPRWIDTEKRKGLDYEQWYDNNWRPQRKFTEKRGHRTRVSHA